MRKVHVTIFSTMLHGDSNESRSCSPPFDLTKPFASIFSRHKSNNDCELYFSTWTCFPYQRRNHHETSCGKNWRGWMKNKSPKRKRLEDGNKTTDFQEDKVRMGGDGRFSRRWGFAFLGNGDIMAFAHGLQYPLGPMGVEPRFLRRAGRRAL